MSKNFIIGFEDRKCNVCHKNLAYVAYGNPSDPIETQLTNSISFCFYCEKDPDKIMTSAKQILVNAENQEFYTFAVNLSDADDKTL